MTEQTPAPRAAREILISAILDDPEHNPRTKSSARDDAGLLKSIAAIGVTAPIAVRPGQTEGWYVIIAGNRRLAQARALVKSQKWPDDATIPALVFDVSAPADIRAIALAENVQRLALHPVDTYEAVAAIMRDGGTVGDAADALGMSSKQVRQAEALGAIAPEIRAEWRAGKIQDDTAKAFTLAPSQERQVEVWRELKKAHTLYAYAVRQAFGVWHEARAGLAVVGEAAYRAAGGTIHRDLFSDDVAISPPELLNQLVDAKIAKKCEALKADGWGWALPKRQVQNSYLYQSATRDVVVSAEEKAEIAAIDQRLDELEELPELDDQQDAEREGLETRRQDIEDAARLRMLTPELMAATGCFVAIDNESPGGLLVEYALTPPRAAPTTATAPAATASPDDDQGPAGPQTSGPLLEQVTSQLTVAVATALASDQTLALRVMLAGLRSFSDSPCRMSSNGLLRSFSGEAFESALADEQSQTPAETLVRATRAIANSLDLRIHRAGQKRRADVQALIEAIGAPAFEAAAREAFDADAYFAKASGAMVDVMTDEINQQRGDTALVAPKGKKAQRAAWAASAARESGWLPPEMRFSAETRSPDNGIDDDDLGDEFHEVGDGE